MKILSIDVGIKNLAFCLLNDNDIEKWDVINVATEEVLVCCYTENNSKCNKHAKFSKESNHYCLAHAKKQNYQLPNNELKESFIKKQKMSKLHEIAASHNILYLPSIKKIELIEKINDHITNSYMERIEDIKASDVNLITIGRNIKKYFDDLLLSIGEINHVVIENQISPIANRMKTIQGMIAQYFIMKNVSNIQFISAINKLKGFNTLITTNNNNNITNENKSNLTYNDRKKLGIQKCLEYLNIHYAHTDWGKYFISHKKKDDLSDSLLQGIWFKNNIIQK
jgi:hypothetical protein